MAERGFRGVRRGLGTSSGIQNKERDAEEPIYRRKRRPILGFRPDKARTDAPVSGRILPRKSIGRVVDQAANLSIPWPFPHLGKAPGK